MKNDTDPDRPSPIVFYAVLAMLAATATILLVAGIALSS